jgi:uncharacterized protein
MRLKNKSSVLFIWIIFCFAGIGARAEVQIPAQPLNHVVDLAGIIEPEMEANLNRYLLELEQKTTAQMIILTIKSLEGESIEGFSIRVAHDMWKLGQKGKDNGVLLLVSLQDMKYRFEVGYGLEGILTDALTSRIGRQYLVPAFRQGDYSGGITAAALAVINEIASDAGVEISGMPKLRSSREYSNSNREGRGATVLEKIVGGLFLLVLLYLFIRNPRLFMLFLVANMLGGGRRGGWGGGGGFGGGGGSFGGGGGGGFGGGGASGGW